ncbi:HMG-box [Backusella circina FSU 941]|nr:HMG-box [Backusella circina FSU 941]
MRKQTSLPLTHIVSPEAIREAQIEETEDALFNQSRPFSAYPSFSLFKQHPTMNDTIVTSTSSLSSSSLSPPPPTTTTEISDKQQKSTEKLKRPPNAYLLFNRDMRRKLLEQSPKMTVGEISKEIGYWWKELPDDQRQFYIKEAALLKQEHLKKYPDFIYTRRSKAELAQAKRKANNNDDDDETDEDEAPKQSTPKRKRNNGEKDPRGRKKKRIKNPFAPKHPMSAYLYYLASVYPEVSQRFPGSTVGPISKTISRTWHSMTKEERTPWIEKAESDKARYAREMQTYMSSKEEEEDLDIHSLTAVVEMVNNS